MTQSISVYGNPYAYTGQANASLGARVGAYLLDGLIFGGASFVAVLLGGLLLGSSELAGVGIALYLLAGVALAVAYWVTMSRGQSPGMKATGVRLVRVQPGAPIEARGPGFWAAYGRGLIFSMSGWIIIGPFSPAFDGTGANRGWHDKASGTWMIDARTEAAAHLFGERVNGTVPGSISRGGPAGSGQLPPPPPPQAAGPAPVPVPSFGAVPVGYVPLPAPAPAAPADAETAMETVIAPPRAGINRPTPSIPVRAAPLMAPPTAPPSTPSTAGVISAVPGFAVRPPAPPVTAAPPAVPRAAPLAAPLAAAVSHDARVDVSLDEDLDETRAVAPAGAAALWALRLDTGEAIDVVGTGFLGRNPAAPDSRAAQLVLYPDDTKSISKTHLSFGVDGARLWVMDRRSTNGTVLIRSGQADVPVDADRPTFVEAGDLLALGDRRISVEAR